MPKYVWWLSIAILVLIPLSGCAQQTVDEAELDTWFTLAVGQSATIKGADLTIKFVEVVSDSRCPKDVICIWMGEASCLVEITQSGATRGKVLTQPGLSGPTTTDYGRYEIRFELLPYPQADKPIKQGDYRLNLTIHSQPTSRAGVLATFDVHGERYRIFITNEETIEELYAVQRGDSQATIPSGRLIKGGVAYNAPWNWHIDPGDVHMAEITIELCDGTPSMVEDDLDYWVDTVQRFCPWGAKLLDVQDYR